MAFSFGTPNTTATTTSFSFSSSTTPAAGNTLNFGSPAAGTTGLQFNTPTTSIPNTGLTFGASFGSTPGGSLSFGTPTTSTNTVLGFKPTTGGLGFGTPAQTSLTLGTPSTTGLTFGSSLQTPTTNSLTPLSFGSTPTTQPIAGTTTSGLTFGGFAAKPTLTFGGATTTAAPLTTGLFSFSTPKTTAATGFTPATSGVGVSLFNTPTIQAATTTPPAAPFRGLGGIDTTHSLTGSGSQSDKSGKEQLIPNEIMQTIENFKNFVKQQKNLATEVSRSPLNPIIKVQEDTEAIRQLLSSLSCTQQKNRIFTNKLKVDTNKCFVQCEMAQRTQDIPIGRQNDNIAPLDFFTALVTKFEKDVQDLRQEIDYTEKHVKSLTQPMLTPQELSVALKRLHDSFVALAGRLQTAHSQVVAQKEQHLSMRRRIINDQTNIFESSDKKRNLPTKKMFEATISPGPTPFSSIGNAHSIGFLCNQDNNMSPFHTSTQLSGWASNTTPNMISGTQNSFLQSPSNSLGTTATDNQNFQLLKPPLGNKRGKR